MKGFDFFMACYREGVDLPVRIFSGLSAPVNFYRPHSVCFINLEADEYMKREHLLLMNGMSVSIIADTIGDSTRELTKQLISIRPRHLVVLCGNNLMSWAGHRGWA